LLCGEIWLSSGFKKLYITTFMKLGTKFRVFVMKFFS